MVPSPAGSRRVTQAVPGMRRGSFLVFLLVALYLLAGVVTALAGVPISSARLGSARTSDGAVAMPPPGTAAHPLYPFSPSQNPSPSVSSGSSTYYVGAQAPTSICTTTCTYLTNSGARTTIQVVSQTVTGCLSYWIGDDSGTNIWGQVGYYICNGATPSAFYQIWNLNNGSALTTGMTAVSTGSHVFSMYSQSGGTVWAYALDGVVFGTYDMGASLSKGTYPVQAVSEEGLVSGPWVPAQVTFSTAIETLQTANTYPTGNGWSSAPSAFEAWGGCTSTGAANNSGGYACWGIAGNLQDPSIPLNSLVTGGTTPFLAMGSNLWTAAAAPDFSLSASPTGVSVATGSAGTSTITVSALNGFAGTVSLAAAVTPSSGLSCTLSPTTVTGSGSSTLSCTGTAAGTYTVTVTGASGSLSHSTTVTYNVSGGISLTLSFFLVGGGTGYTAPTFTYLQGGTTKTVTLTTSATAYTVDPNSAWSVTNPLAGSSASERWQTNQAASGTATASATIVFTYYHQYAVTFAYSVVGGGSGYSAPSVAYTAFGGAASVTTGSPAWADAGTAYAYPVSLAGSGSSEAWRSNTPSGTIAGSATVTVAYYHQFSVTFGYTILGGGSGYTAPTIGTTQFGAGTQIMAATAAWVDAGASYAYTNPLGGSSTTQRWFTPSPSGTVSAAGTITTPFYHQFLDTFTYGVVGGGSGYSAPTVGFVSLGAGSATATGIAVWADAGTTFQFQSPLTGSTGTESWGTNSASGTVTQAATYSATYYHQFVVTFAYQVFGGGTGYSAPTVSYSAFATSASTATGGGVWADAGTTFAYPGSLSGSTALESWRTNAATGTISGAGTLTVSYYHEYSVTFTYTIFGGGSGYTAPTVSTTQFGVSVSFATGTAAWVDAGASYAYTNPLGGSSTSQRWIAPSAGGAVSAAGTVGATYYRQFLITFSYAVVGGGSGYTGPTVGYVSQGASSSTATGIAVWADSGSTYVFTNPLQGSTGTEAWKTATASGTATQSGTVSTSYYHQDLATFAFQVLGGGSGYAGPAVAYTSLGTAASTATGVGVWADVGSSFQFQSPLGGSTSSERWQSPSPTGTVTTSATITASYYHEFSVTFGYTVQGGGTGYTAPSVSTTQLGATTTVGMGVATWVDAGSAYAFANPLGGSTGSERWVAAVSTGTVTAAGTVSATYVHQVSVTFAYAVQGGGSGYSAPSVAYSSLGTSASTLTGSSVWADASTAYAFANALPGSSSTAAWRAGAGTGTVTVPGTVTTTYYYQFLVDFLVQVVNGPAPPIMPTLTATQFGVATSLTAGGSSWVDANGSYSYPASFAGAPGEQWMSASPSSGTVTLPGTLTASYYHQYTVTFAYAVSGGGTGYGAPTVTYVALGASLTTTAGTTAWTDAGSAFAYASALTGGASNERWMTGAPGGTVTGTDTFTVTYVHQFWVDFSYVVKGGGTGYSAPNVTFSNLSATADVVATSLWVWANAGASYSYQNPLPGSTSTNSWQTNNGVGSVGSSTTYSATYRHQYKVKFKATTTSGTVTPETPLVNVTVFGLNVSLPADNVTWVDAGSGYGFPSVFYGPLPGERWITSTPPSGVILGPTNITAAYQHQYYLTIQVNAPAGGSVSGDPGWYNETIALQLRATAAPGWQFQGWIGGGTGSYTGSSVTAPVAMDAPVTETAVFYVGLTLSASAGGSLEYSYGGTSGWVPGGGSETLYLTPGTQVTVTASPSLFYQLHGWGGSASGTQASVILVADTPQTLSATYSVSLYSKVDSILGVGFLATLLLGLALGVRRHRRKKRERAMRQARLRGRSLAQANR